MFTCVNPQSNQFRKIIYSYKIYKDGKLVNTGQITRDYYEVMTEEPLAKNAVEVIDIWNRSAEITAKFSGTKYEYKLITVT